MIEAGDAREVHHCALLVGYGAGVVNPYLAFETLDDMIRQGILRGITHDKAVKNYIKGSGKAVLKKQLKRDQMATFFANQPPCLIGVST